MHGSLSGKYRSTMKVPNRQPPRWILFDFHHPVRFEPSEMSVSNRAIPRVGSMVCSLVFWPRFLLEGNIRTSSALSHSVRCGPTLIAATLEKLELDMGGYVP